MVDRTQLQSNQKQRHELLNSRYNNSINIVATYRPYAEKSPIIESALPARTSQSNLR
jgi:hypothetical protein